MDLANTIPCIVPDPHKLAGMNCARRYCHGRSTLSMAKLLDKLLMVGAAFVVSLTQIFPSALICGCTVPLMGDALLADHVKTQPRLSYCRITLWLVTNVPAMLLLRTVYATLVSPFPAMSFPVVTLKGCRP